MMGAQEGSKDLHTLLEILGSLAAQSACLIGRVSKVGESFRQAAKRRKWIEREEERMKAERRTFWHANVCELGLSRRGQFIIPI